MPQIQESEVRLLLKTCPDRKTSELSKDVSLVTSLTKVLVATMEINPKDRASFAISLSKKGLALSGVAATATESKELKEANLVATQALKSIGLRKLAGMTSPAKVSIYVTLTVAEKVIGAASMGDVDKCKMAIASVSATFGMGAMTCFASGAFTMGIGCVAGAIATANEIFNYYGQCHGTSAAPTDTRALPSASNALP